ncbi:MAG: cation transporter [Proteobacteria bacterium]|nr:cation transporter [Pseudomonadota bacterium]NOG60021.1 cation transporter [Pseudomonadota bacterium]
MTNDTKILTFSERDKKVLKLILIEGSANLLVLLAKLFVGLSTGSMAVLADAIHSLTDVANNIVAWVVVRLSAMPADREHPYGHRKFETLAVFVLATFLAVLAFEIARNAVTKEVTEIVSGQIELIVMVIVLVINISLAVWQRYWAKKLKSSIMLADAAHTFADVLTTIIVIIGWQLSSMGFLILDRLCALGVAGFVFYLSYSLYKTAFPVLVDEYAIDPEDIKRAVFNVDGVKEVGRIRSRWIGSDIALDVVVSVNAKLTTEESHRIADKIETIIEQQFKVRDAFIHIEPFKE